MRYFPTFDDEGCCDPTVFEGPVTDHDCYARLECPGNVSLCRLIGLVLGITCVGERICGMLLKVMTNACEIYDRLGEVLCQSGGAVMWRVGFYVSLDFF